MLNIEFIKALLDICSCSKPEHGLQPCYRAVQRKGLLSARTGHFPPHLLCCSIMQPRTAVRNYNPRLAGTHFVIICKIYRNPGFICKEIWTNFKVRVNFGGSLMVIQIPGWSSTDLPASSKVKPCRTSGHHHIIIIRRITLQKMSAIMNFYAMMLLGIKLMSYHGGHDC